MKPNGQATIIFILVLLVIVVLIGLLIGSGGVMPWTKRTATPWTPPSATVTETVTPVPTDNPTPEPTAIISPTLTIKATEYPTPQLTWEPTLPVWTVTPAPPPMEWAIIRSCAPKYTRQACYWRCCEH